MSQLPDKLLFFRDRALIERKVRNRSSVVVRVGNIGDETGSTYE
jgi:hypothetical protein